MFLHLRLSLHFVVSRTNVCTTLVPPCLVLSRLVYLVPPSLSYTNVQDGRPNHIAGFCWTSTSLLHVFTCYLNDKITFMGTVNDFWLGLAGVLSTSQFPTGGVFCEETASFLIIFDSSFFFSLVLILTSGDSLQVAPAHQAHRVRILCYF